MLLRSLSLVVLWLVTSRCSPPRLNGPSHPAPFLSFFSVLFAIGRDACTDKSGREKVDVKTNPKNLKVIVNEADRSNIPYIHAIGDIADGKLELTPVAIQVRDSRMMIPNYSFSLLYTLITECCTEH